MRINRRSVLLGGLGAALRSLADARPGHHFLPHRHRRHGRHLFPDRRPDRQRHLQSAGLAHLRRRRLVRRAGRGGHGRGLQRLGRQCQRPSPAASAQSGFIQSDVAYWAFNASGIYEGRPKVDVLRAIANLYPESFHLVARKGAGIKSIKDLKGKRVSLDEPGSGTLVDARLILAAYGLTEKDLKAEYLKAQQAADKLKDGCRSTPSSASAAGRWAPSPSWPRPPASTWCRSTGRRPRAWSRRTASSPPTRFPTAPTRASPA